MSFINYLYQSVAFDENSETYYLENIARMVLAAFYHSCVWRCIIQYQVLYSSGILYSTALPCDTRRWLKCVDLSNWSNNENKQADWLILTHNNVTCLRVCRRAIDNTRHRVLVFALPSRRRRSLRYPSSKHIVIDSAKRSFRPRRETRACGPLAPI